MPDIEVGPRSLRDAARGSRDLAGDVRGVDPTTVERIRQAMPDSGPALNARGVSDYWTTKLRKLASALDERADKLVAAANGYDAGERDMSADFHAVLHASDARPPRK